VPGPCPICGKASGSCGDQPLAFPPIDPIAKGANVADTKIYVPKQRQSRGVAGYRGANVVIVDPDSGKEAPAPKSTAKSSRKK
jgi:hypothetical protein